MSPEDALRFLLAGLDMGRDASGGTPKGIGASYWLWFPSNDPDSEPAVPAASRPGRWLDEKRHQDQ